MALGQNTSATNTNSMAFGVEATSSGNAAMALGFDADASGQRSTALGANSKATALDSMALGARAEASATQATALGYEAKASGTRSLALGREATAEADDSTAIGASAKAEAEYSTALGYNAKADRVNEVSIGNDRSPYSMPGLAPKKGFIDSSYQNSGSKRFVTTDNEGTLGTTNFSVDDLVDTVGATGALSAALGSLPITTTLPDESVRCGLGSGFYQNQWAGSVGCAVKVKNRLFFNAGIAATPTESVLSNPMGRVGFSIGFGGAPPKKHQDELSKMPDMLGNGNMITSMGNGTPESKTSNNTTNDAVITSEQGVIAMLTSEVNTLKNREQTNQETIEQLQEKLNALLNRNSSAKDNAELSDEELALSEKLKSQIEALKAQREEEIQTNMATNNAQNQIIEDQRRAIAELQMKLSTKDSEIEDLQQKFAEILTRLDGKPKAN